MGVTIGAGTISERVRAAGPGNQEWVFEPTDGGNPSLTVADGTVYVGSTRGNLYAVDATTGNQQWAFEAGFTVTSSPTVADDTVYVGNHVGKLYAVDAATRYQQWAFETGNRARLNSSPTVTKGTVYVGCQDGRLYAVDAATGNQEWAFETGRKVTSSPTAVDDTVYVGSYDENLYAIDAATGNQEWVYETGDRVLSSPTVANGTVYVGSYDGKLYAVNATTGNQEWALEIGDFVESSPTVADGTVYVGSDDNNLYAVDATTGNQEWAFKAGLQVRSSPTVVDGTVYVGSRDDNLYAVGTDHTKSSSGSRVSISQGNKSPTAAFTVEPSSPTTETTVSFDASSAQDDGGITRYQWDFDGDGTVEATGEQPTYQYETPGSYSVELTVRDADGATDTTTRLITVSEPEKSDQSSETSGSETFTYKPSSPTVDTSVKFDANEFPSDATATSYEWDFTGDGTADAFSSTVRHIFSSGGTQTVTLTAELESGETKTTRRSVLVNTPPEPEFSISPSPAIIEEPTTFDASETTDSTGSIESYEWDFDGDGTVDKTGRAVTHTFAEEGRPTVTLRVTDTQGVTATESRSVRVQRAATFSVQLRDTTITPDGETTAAITVNNLLGSDRLLTQLELDLPSGWDVTFVDAASAGGGTATEIFETQAGQTRTIRARITPNDTGEFSVGGRAFYYIGDQSPPRHTRQLSSGTLTVTDGETTSESTASPTEDPPTTASGETAQTGTETSTTMPGLGMGAGATALGAGLGVLRALDLLDDDDSDQSEKE